MPNTSAVGAEFEVVAFVQVDENESCTDFTFVKEICDWNIMSL